MHVNAVVSFAAVALQVKLAELLLFVRHDMLVFKLALHPLRTQSETALARSKQTS